MSVARIQLNGTMTASVANHGGNSRLEQQVEQQILMDKNGEQRISQIRKDQEKTSEITQPRVELNNLKRQPPKMDPPGQPLPGMGPPPLKVKPTMPKETSPAENVPAES